MFSPIILTVDAFSKTRSRAAAYKINCESYIQRQLYLCIPKVNFSADVNFIYTMQPKSIIRI